MTAHGFESLGETLKRLGISLPTGGSVAVEDEPVGCSRCRDAGWLSRNGTPVECPCGLVAQRRLDIVWARSQVPLMMREWTLASYVERSGRAELVAEIRRVWDETDRWLLLTGPVGVGKSGIAASLLNEHLAAGQGGMYVVAPTLLERIRSTYDAEEKVSEATVMSGLVQTPLLVLDDLGKGKLTEWGQEKLYTLISERYHARRRTIVTSNYGLSDGALEAHLWEATFDRLRGASESFEIDGESLR